MPGSSRMSGVVKRALWAGALMAVLPASVALAEGEMQTRVFDPPAGSQDARLHDSHDVDHPAVFEPTFADKAQWEQRAQEIRQQMLVALGLWPMPPKTPLNPVIRDRIDRDAYTVEKVYFSSYPGHYVSGNLYRPKGKTGPLPAVLCPHGHWANGRLTVNNEKTIEAQMKSGAEATHESAYAPQQARCAMLARMGCVVFHYDMVGMGDSKSIGHRDGFLDAEAELRLQSFMGMQTWNSIRSLDFLLSLPEVDPKRVAVTGESGGGTQTMILCAIDPRPAVSVPAVMVSTHMQGGCICENCSLLRVGTNNLAFASLVAPRPQAMTSANDWTSDLETNGLPQIKAIYRLYGVEDKVTGKHFNFEHNYNQVSREFMYEWVNKYLSLGYPSPVKEVPFEPLTPEQISVFDATHTRPSDSLNSHELRKQMTEVSERLIDGLAKKPDEFHEVVRVALRAMVGGGLPQKGTVTQTPTGEQTLAGNLHLTRGTLRREGQQIPFVQLSPEKWNGTVAIWIDPAGKAGVADGGKPQPAVAKLLQQGEAVLAIDLYQTGEARAGDAPVTQPSVKYAGNTYAGYRLGYNRSLAAERVQDILTAIAAARDLEGARQVRLLAFGSAGPCGLLARALSGDTIERAAIDLNGFDFDDVTSIEDEMLIPGGVKYGGIWGFASLCTTGQTSLWNAPGGMYRQLALSSGHVKLQSADKAAMASELAQ